MGWVLSPDVQVEAGAAITCSGDSDAGTPLCRGRSPRRAGKLRGYAKEWCEVWLAGSAIIDLWNTCVLLEHAHNCHAQQLVDLALFHIQKMFKFVENTEEWHNLDDELQKLVYRPQNDGESDED